MCLSKKLLNDLQSLHLYAIMSAEGESNAKTLSQSTNLTKKKPKRKKPDAGVELKKLLDRIFVTNILEALTPQP
jgi:hypothetical protein